MFREIVPWRQRAARPLVRFEREVENLWERFFGEEGWMPSEEALAPRCDLAETDTHYEVKVDLPGMKSDDVNVEFKDGALWISGRTEESHEEQGKTFHRVERRFGEFRRTLMLPGKVDAEKVDAKFHDGVLKVTVAKAEESKPKKIEVKHGSNPIDTHTT